MRIPYVLKALAFAITLFTFNSSNAQNDADPAITSMNFGESPIVIGHTTTLTVFFLNNGFTTSIPTGSVGLNISLPTSAEYVASPLSTAAISGTIASKFNWTFNNSTKTFFGVTNQAIAPGDGGTIIINVKGMTATISSQSVANIQRLNPSQYPNENINNNNLTSSLSVVPGSPLPITLLNFTATKQISVVNLNWQTSSESNSKHFEVQYSKDGTNWQTIATIAASGSSNSTKSYAYVHAIPVNGINYYRLSMVDMDNRFTYSDTRTVNFNTKNSITVMPNPVRDRLYITSNGGGSLQSVSIISTDGRVINTVSHFALGQSIEMSQCLAGLYTLRFIDRTGVAETIKIIKQ